MNEIKRVIKYCEQRYRFAIMDGDGEVFFPYKTAIAALREKAGRENPKPLTWKEIKAFESMREVFLKELKTDLRHRLNCYAIRNDDGFILDTDNGLGYFKLLKEEYGKLYVAYRYKPEEAT